MKLGVTANLVRMMEKFRGKGAVVQAAEVMEQIKSDLKKSGNFAEKLLGPTGLAAAAGMIESELGKELKKIKKRTKKYFPKAVRAYQEIHDLPGMETFKAHDFEKIRDLITTTSAVPAEWSPEQPVIGEIQYNPIVGVPSLRIPRTDWFNPGTLVRIRSRIDPEKVEYQLAWFNVPSSFGNGGGQGGRTRPAGGQRARIGGNAARTIFRAGIMLKGPLQYKYKEREALVSALLRHPVNINSASPLVLEAIFKGLRSAFAGMGGSNQVVTTKEAKALAAYLKKNTPIASFEHFRSLVEEAQSDDLLKANSVQLILTNAVNPNHPYISCSTTGFCYSTSDIYSIDSIGVINSPGGLELARSHVREIVEIAPPETLAFSLEDQDDWHYRVFSRPTPDRAMWRRFPAARIKS